MSRFISVDLNGWLDRLFEPDIVLGNEVVKEKASALGFRSCLFRHKDVCLFGAQALSAARHARTNRPLIDAFDALATTAGHGKRASAERGAVSTALWQLAVDAGRRNGTQDQFGRHHSGWPKSWSLARFRNDSGRDRAGNPA